MSIYHLLTLEVDACCTAGMRISTWLATVVVAVGWGLAKSFCMHQASIRCLFCHKHALELVGLIARTGTQTRKLPEPTNKNLCAVKHTEQSLDGASSLISYPPAALL
jgi:hypothetical protein